MRITTRYEKFAANYRAMIKLATIRIWLRFYESSYWCTTTRTLTNNSVKHTSEIAEQG